MLVYRYLSLLTVLLRYYRLGHEMTLIGMQKILPHIGRAAEEHQYFKELLPRSWVVEGSILNTH